jgi:hypothetical protein
MSATASSSTKTAVLGRADREEEHWSTRPVKLTMNLPEGCVENIKWLAGRYGIPNSHVVRRAVDLRYRLQKEMDAGAKLLIERDGQFMTIWFD